MDRFSLGRALIATAAMALLAGCSVTPDNLPPAPLTPDMANFYTTPAYRVRVADVLDIRLLLNPELNEEVTVRPDGHISTTLVSDMEAANKTVPQLTQDLIAAYSRDLRTPRISVIVKSSAPTEVFVAGEVAVPGQVSTDGPAPTLSQAISRAGGTKLSADDDRVFIIRRRFDDTPQFLSVRFEDLTHAHDASADIRLAPFDVVYVPRTGIAEVYRWYNQHVQQFANPNFDFSFLLNPSNAGNTVITH